MKNTLLKIVSTVCILLAIFGYNSKNDAYAEETKIKNHLFQSESLDIYKQKILDNTFRIGIWR